MRLQRLAFILFAVFVVFVGGSPYYYTIFPIRVLTHIVFTVIFALWLIQRLRRRRGLPHTPLNLALLAAVIAAACSIVFSLSPRMAFENAWLPYIHLLIFFVLAAMFQAGRQRLIWETQFMLAALVVILAGVQFGSFLFGWGITPETRVGWLEAGRPPVTPMLYLPLGVSTWLAAYAAPLVLLAFAWGRSARRKDEQRVLYILAALLVLVVIATTSRGGWLALAAGVVGFAGLRVINALRVPAPNASLAEPHPPTPSPSGEEELNAAQRGEVNQTSQHVNSPLPEGEGQGVRASQGVGAERRRRWLLTAGAVALLLIVVIAGVIVIGRSASRSSGDFLRVNLWRTAVSITGAYPVFGVGVGEFGHAARTYRDPTVVDDRLGSAHNVILNTAAETGIAGVLVLGWLGLALLIAWWRLRRRADAGYALRLDAALAALGAITVQSMVDTFTATPIVVLIVLLAAYCVVPVKVMRASQRAGQAPPLQTDDAGVPPSPRLRGRGVGGEGRIFPLLALILLLAYAAFWFMADRAQAQLIRAARNGDLSAAYEAAALDPSLPLYELQIAYLTGNQAQGDPSLRGEAIRLYEAALQREPTWDTGWINLAGLYEQDGRSADALAALERADAINRGSPARFNWARIAETHNLASDEAIISAYVNEMAILAWRQLPLSSFWMETPLRRAALERFYDEMATDAQRRRIAAVHFPERLAELPVVPPDLSTGDGWAEAARALAESYDPTASYQDDPLAQIETMLNRAEVLLTFYEYPNAIRALVAERLGAPPDIIDLYRLAAVPPRYQDQNFEGVLFGGRAAGLEIFPFMRRPSGGYPLFAPYYAAAESYEARGNRDGAAQIYRYILDYAPDETLARERLAALDLEAGS